MIIDTKLAVDDKGVITAPQSTYRPEKKEQDRISMVLRDFGIANRAKTKTYREFDNMTLMERQSTDQYRFNSFQFLDNTLPGEEWKSNAVRPITRNRVISIAAHITQSLVYPQVYARDNDDVDDQGAASVMRDLMEWSNDEANYEQTFTYAAIAMLVNPAVIIQTEYAEVYRTVKREKDDGTIVEEQILDEEYSGFKDEIVPLDEFWHPNFYEHSIQRQGFLIRRRALMWDDAMVKYGDNEKFKTYVRPGIQIMFGPDGTTFYEQYDTNLGDELVEEVIYWNRNLDLMLTLVNGVLISDPDQMNPRYDKAYPFIKGGFELLDEGKFFYYKSQVNKLGPDEETIQVLYRMIIDGTYLQLMPPGIIFGDDVVSESMISPGTLTTLKETSKFQAINIGSNLQGGLNMMSKVEQSVTESSVDPSQSGVSRPGDQTAYETDSLEQNAKTMLGLFGKMIGFMVRDFSELRINDILQYMTIGDVSDLESGSEMLAFRSFLLPDKMVNGKRKNRRIQFTTDGMPTEPLPKSELLNKSFDLLEEEHNKYNDKMQLVKVNPDLFRQRKFKIRITPEMVLPVTDKTRRAMNLEEYDRAINNPLADQEAIYRDLLLGSYETTKNEPDKYVKKGGMPGAAPQSGGLPALLQNTRQQATQSQLMSKPLAAFSK